MKGGCIGAVNVCIVDKVMVSDEASVCPEKCVDSSVCKVDVEVCCEVVKCVVVTCKVVKLKVKVVSWVVKFVVFLSWVFGCVLVKVALKKVIGLLVKGGGVSLGRKDLVVVKVSCLNAGWIWVAVKCV